LALINKKRSVLFCALEIFAHVGGMQRFNRRVVDTLLERTRSNTDECATVHILRDHQQQIPRPKGAAVLKGFNRNRFAFIWESLAVAINESDMLVLGHINLIPIAFIGKLLKPNLKTLLFAHGIEVWDTTGYRRFYERWMLRNSIDSVAAVSRYTAHLMCDRLGIPEQRVSILPNAVDPVIVAPGINRDGTLSLLTVSRLSAGDRQKNVDKIIYAVAALKTTFPTLSLEIVGEGALRGELETLADKLGVRERVRFLGKLSDSELVATYQRASLFVLPSAKEGFGIVYLEAWQQGLPVIAASAGATPEVVTNGVDGILVDLDDPNGLVDAIARSLRDKPLMRELAVAGKRKVEEHYLHKHFSANLNRIISELG
jgi:glycosyltransferase involved in cell wall biosynthesis